MADNEAKANDLMAQASKKLNSSKGFLSSLFGGSSKVEEAAELYVRAANTYKMAKKWSAAGDAFCQSANIQLKLGSRHEAATNFVDAGNCFKKSDPHQAISSIEKAIEIYTDMGRFTIAAKHHVTIAEIYETELLDVDKAMTAYEQAADYFQGEESASSANKCLLKVAEHAAKQENYTKAIEIYEKVAESAMNNKLIRYTAEDHFFRAGICHMCVETQGGLIAINKYEEMFPALDGCRKMVLLKVAQSCMDTQLLRYNAKDYFFRAAICHMCVESQDAAIAVQKFEEMFPTFSDSRECKLVKTLIGAVEDNDVDKYTDALREYDSISRLDQWYTTMLLRVKKTIEGDADLR